MITSSVSVLIILWTSWNGQDVGLNCSPMKWERGQMLASECLMLFSRDGSVGPVSRYREHFTEIP